MPPKRPHIENLPVEILDEILDIVGAPLRSRNPNDPAYWGAQWRLANCQATSRTLRAHARPRLFRHVCISMYMSFPWKRVERLWDLEKDDPTGGPLVEMREFCFFQETDQLGVEPVGEKEQDAIADIFQRLLDFNLSRGSKLESVTFALDCLRWAGLSERLRSVLTAMVSPTSPVKILRLERIRDIPASLLTSTSQLTTLVLDESSLSHSDQASRPPGDESPDNLSKHRITQLSIPDVGPDDAPLDFKLIGSLGSQLRSLEIWFNKPRWWSVDSHSVVQGAQFPHKPPTHDIDVLPVGSFATLVTGPSTSPCFPKLRSLCVGIHMHDHKISSRKREETHLGPNLELIRWTEFVTGFFRELPLDHAPLLEELQLSFRPAIGKLVEERQAPKSEGWVKKEWEDVDEYLLSLLQKRSQQPGALPLRIPISFDYRFVLSNRGDALPVYREPKDLEALWEENGYPRANLRQLFPRTLAQFPYSLSLREGFSISYDFIDA